MMYFTSLLLPLAALLVAQPAAAAQATAPVSVEESYRAYDHGDIRLLEQIASGQRPLSPELSDTAGEAVQQRLSLAKRLLELDRAAAYRAFAALAADVTKADQAREEWVVDQRPAIIEIYDILAVLQTEHGDVGAAAISALRSYQNAGIVFSADSDAMAHARSQLASARQRAGLPPVDFEAQKRRQRAAPGRNPFNLIEVHYATHRKPTGSTAPGRFYGSATGPMRYGRAVVSVPTSREIGSLPKPSIWSLEFRTDPAKHVSLTKVQPISDRQSFLKSVASKIGRSRHKDIFVFVHGYNSSFEAAVERAAQIAADLHMDGVPIVYSWPSQGSVAGYLLDAKAIAQPQLPADLAILLTDVARRTGARRVHLVAHSMGNRLMLAALQRLASSGNAPKFSEVVFAAPDVGQRDFVSALTKIRPLGNRFTLYASKRDKALLLSQHVNGEVRAGDANKIVIRPGLQSIDTTLASGGLLGHNDFAGTALEDFRAVLWLSLAPDKRCVLRASGAGASRYWMFGKGCDEREFREATARVWSAGSAAAALKNLDAEIAKKPQSAGVLQRVRQRVLSTFGRR